LAPNSDSDLKSPVVASPLAWILLLVVVLGVLVAVFVWMGGLRLVKRWMGMDGRRTKRKPNSRRDGYMRVDLEK
jgi:hypothetical protein